MITNQLLLTTKTLRSSNGNRVDEDFFDRVIGTHSIVIIGIFLFVLTTSYFFGRPLALISCWCPAEFTGEMTSYANTLCWTSNTYVLPVDNDTLPGRTDLKPKSISYYQWVPFILMSMAFVLFLPGFVWRRLYAISRLEPKLTVIRLQKLNLSSNFDANIYMIAEQFGEALNAERDYLFLNDSKLGSAFLCWPRLILRRNGIYLSACYFLNKISQVVSTVSLLVFMNRLMDMRTYFTSLKTVQRMFFSGNHLLKTKYANNPYNLFPYKTLCEFKIRGLGDKFKEYLLQCTLPINLFNEKIFVFLWLWMLTCTLMSIFACIRFIFTNIFTRSNHLFMKRVCGQIKFQGYIDSQIFTFFVDHYCSNDGVFVLRMFEKNLPPDVFLAFINALWNVFIKSQKWRFHIDDTGNNNEKEMINNIVDKF